MIARILAATMALATATTASAGTFTCLANPATYLGLGADGTVYTAIQDVGISGICNMTVGGGGITPQGCSGWYSLLITLKVSGKSATVHYSDANASACSSYQQWDVHNPYYMTG